MDKLTFNISLSPHVALEVQEIVFKRRLATDDFLETAVKHELDRQRTQERPWNTSRIRSILWRVTCKHILALLCLVVSLLILANTDLERFVFIDINTWRPFRQPTSTELSHQISFLLFCLTLTYLLSPIIEEIFPNNRIGKMGFFNGLVAGAIAGPIGCWSFISRSSDFAQMFHKDLTTEYGRRIFLVVCFSALGGAVLGQVIQIYRHFNLSNREDDLGMFVFFRQNFLVSLIFMSIIIFICSVVYVWKIQSSGRFFGWSILTPGTMQFKTAIQYRDLLLIPLWFGFTVTTLNSTQGLRHVFFRLIDYVLIPTRLVLALVATFAVPEFPRLNNAIGSQDFLFFIVALAISMFLVTWFMAAVESAVKSQLENELQIIHRREQQKMKVLSYRGRIDVVVISVTPEEQAQMQAKLEAGASKDDRDEIYGIYYHIYTIKTDFGAERTILYVRLPDQGNIIAAEMLQSLLTHFDPQLMMLVGIAGGIATTEFSLGDVLMSTRVVDLTTGKENADGTTVYDDKGGPMARAVQGFITSLPGSPCLHDWHTSISIERPFFDFEKIVQRFEKNNPPSLNKTIKQSVLENLINRPLLLSKWRPKVIEAVTVSDGKLNRNPETADRFKGINRKICNVDMECAGAYAVTRERCPILIIRAISDIIGLVRDENREWTKYAAESAASFAYTLIKKERLLPRRDSALRGSA